MSNGNIEQKRLQVMIYGYIQAAGGFATYEQIMLHLENIGIGSRGDVANVDQRNSNVVFWLTSAEVAEVLAKGFEEQLFGIEVVSPMVYIGDRVSPDLPILNSRQVNRLLRDWRKGYSTAWVDKPIWLPVIILAGDVTAEDLMTRKITPAMLETVLNNTADGEVWLEQFQRLASENVSKPVAVNGEGNKGA